MGRITNKKNTGKQTMVQAIVVNTSLTHEQGTEAVDALLGLIHSTLMNEGKVLLPNIGTLSMKVIPAGTTKVFGEAKELPTRFKVKFSQSRNFKPDDPLDKIVENKADSPLDALKKLSFISKDEE